MTHLILENDKDKLLKLIDSNKVEDMASIVRHISNDPTKLIFPVCGKRCYNTLSNYRKKEENKVDSEYATTQNWEKDGTSTKMCSIEVLVDWLTTEENCSKYFGGLDANGRTSADRKEAYHHRIRDLIKAENGM